MPAAEPSRGARKSTQRERLLNAMIDIAGREGLTAATIARVIAKAGVSRPTFYEYFHDRDACFVTALASVQQQVLAEVRRAVEGQGSERVAKTAIGALIDFADSHPERARVVLSEALGGGARALDVRDRGIAEIASLIEQVEQQASKTAAIPDLCISGLIGGVCRMLATRLCRGELDASLLREDLLRWVATYERAIAAQGRRTREPVALAAPPLPSAALRAPPPLPPGRPRVDSEEVLYNQRLRILLATAEVAGEKGCPATTIVEITRRAGIDGRAFYRQFANKREAFAAVHELFLQHLVAHTASAFFTGESWQERIWKAQRAFAGVLESNPTLAYFEFVASHSACPLATQHFNDAAAAFTIFLQEGLHQHHANHPPHVTLEAIMATSFEVLYLQIRRHVDIPLVGLIPHLARLSLVPFLGIVETDAFVEQKLRDAAVFATASTRQRDPVQKQP